LKVDEEAEQDQLARLTAFRAQRNQAEVASALTALRDTANNDSNIMPVSIHCARVGVTTGEWAQTLREVFGEFRAPTGISGAASVQGVEGAIADKLELVR